MRRDLANEFKDYLWFWISGLCIFVLSDHRRRLRMAFNVSKQITLSLSARSFGTIHQITRSFKFATPLHQQVRLCIGSLLVIDLRHVP